ncbi:MAG: hypothetical protein KKA90_00810 [Nanoarchaeota archaeon]|nr:hypothetical protein [Nanoarchaeota archaeon]
MFKTPVIEEATMVSAKNTFGAEPDNFFVRYRTVEKFLERYGASQGPLLDLPQYFCKTPVYDNPKVVMALALHALENEAIHNGKHLPTVTEDTLAAIQHDLEKHGSREPVLTLGDLGIRYFAQRIPIDHHMQPYLERLPEDHHYPTQKALLVTLHALERQAESDEMNASFSESD